MGVRWRAPVNARPSMKPRWPSVGTRPSIGVRWRHSDEDTPHGVCMMPHSSSSLPYPGFLYISGSHLIQGQPLEKQNWNLKIQRCTLQKNSDILKPYICTYQDCGKSYSKSSHLRIHECQHTGEWRLKDGSVRKIIKDFCLYKTLGSFEIIATSL